MAASEVLRVETVADVEALLRLEAEWESLWREDATADIFTSFTWFLTWWKHFGHGDSRAALVSHDGGELFAIAGGTWRLQVLVVRDGTGAVQAILPLVNILGTFKDVRCRILATPVNSHSVRAGILARRFDAAVATTLAAALRDNDAWNVLLLNGFARRHACANELVDALLHAGHIPGPAGTVPSAYLRFAGTWDEYMSGGARRHFRRSLVKAERGLEKIGAITWERHANADAATSGTALFMEVDSSSWKARSGESVATTPMLRAYYTDLCRCMAEVGQIEIWILRIGGQPAAAFLCLNDGRALYSLKSSFSESFGDNRSPSFVLIRHIIHESWGGGLHGVDFVGKVPFLDRWATEDLAILHATIYRDRGVAARIAVHEAGARARAWLAALPGRVRRRLHEAWGPVADARAGAENARAADADDRETGR